MNPADSIVSITTSVKITFIFCQFINNSFLGGPYSGLNGIVHAKYRATVIITNCYFFNNIASVYGINIIIGDSEVHITITHSQFTKNMVYEIISIESNSRLKIAHSEFTTNRGGRVTRAEDDSHVIISCSYFKNNCYSIFISPLDSRISIDGGNRRGGAVHANRNVNITLAHSYFEGCSDDRNRYKTLYNKGGVVYANGVIYLKIIYCQFISNTAYISGGALYNKGGVVYANGVIYLKIIYCQFISNTAYISGGALYLKPSSISSGYNLLIIGSEFSDNRAKRNEGGSIFLVGGSLVIHNNTFDYNLAGSDGGALYIEDAFVRVTETEFSNNKANRNGGIMSGFKIKTYSANCSFFTNCAGGNGGLFMSLQETYTYQEIYVKITQQTMMAEFYTQSKVT